MNAAATLFWSRPLRVFDLDGTLVDTLPDLSASLDDALADLGLPAVPAAVVRESVHLGLEGSAQAALAELQAPAALAELLVARYRQRYDERLTHASHPYAGVPELLERLRERGDRLAVCTNKTQAQAQRLLAALGLAGCFGAVVGADTCGQRKPHPAPLWHALQASRMPVPSAGALAAQALMVGDSDVDRDCARAAGVAMLRFGDGYGGPGDGSDAVFHDWATLLQAEPAMAAGPWR